MAFLKGTEFTIMKKNGECIMMKKKLKAKGISLLFIFIIANVFLLVLALLNTISALSASDFVEVIDIEFVAGLHLSTR